MRRRDLNWVACVGRSEKSVLARGLSCSGFLSTDDGSAQEFRTTDGRPLR